MPGLVLRQHVHGPALWIDCSLMGSDLHRAMKIGRTDYGAGAVSGDPTEDVVAVGALFSGEGVEAGRCAGDGRREEEQCEKDLDILTDAFYWLRYFNEFGLNKCPQ